MKESTKKQKGTDRLSKTSNSNLAEKVLISSFVIFGIIGFMIILESMTYKRYETFQSPIYNPKTNGIIDERSKETKNSSSKSHQTKNVKKELIKGKQLHIGGPREAYTPVLFEVENFNLDAEYTLDFGDGIHRILNQRTDSHIYEHSGNYQLKLYVTYKGEQRMLYDENVEIMEPIIVATNATRYDF